MREGVHRSRRIVGLVEFNVSVSSTCSCSPLRATSQETRGLATYTGMPGRAWCEGWLVEQVPYNCYVCACECVVRVGGCVGANHTHYCLAVRMCVCVSSPCYCSLSSTRFFKTVRCTHRSAPPTVHTHCLRLTVIAEQVVSVVPQSVCPYVCPFVRL